MARNLVAELMAETVSYGGFAATRAEVYEDIQTRLPEAPRYGIGADGWRAESPPVSGADEAAALIPWNERPDR